MKLKEKSCLKKVFIITFLQINGQIENILGIWLPSVKAIFLSFI